VPNEYRIDTTKRLEGLLHVVMPHLTTKGYVKFDDIKPLLIEEEEKLLEEEEKMLEEEEKFVEVKENLE